MAIDKITPKSPDQIIDNDRYGGSTFARFAHLNYIIDQINAGNGFIPNLQQVVDQGGIVTGSGQIRVSDNDSSTIINANGIGGQNNVPSTTWGINNNTGAASLGDTLVTKVTNNNGIIKPYKSYVAYLTQTGIADPVATVFENNLTGFIEWERLNTGEYIGTLPNAFVNNKTWLSINFNIGEIGNEAKASFVTNNVNSVLLYTYEASATIAPATDGFKAYVEIRVYD